MWLIILAFAAAIVTPIWYSMAEDDKYLLKLLCLILWGATIMVFVDHVMGYLMEGGEFLEFTLDATVLGFSMLIAALVIWEIALILKDPKKVLYKKRSGEAQQ
jgi:O-antigen/teichoic acid export membrane protein